MKTIKKIIIEALGLLIIQLGAIAFWETGFLLGMPILFLTSVIGTLIIKLNK